MTLAAAIAWKNLSRERVRLAISLGGVAFAVVLILLVRGLYNGFTYQSTLWIESVGGDVWVAQEAVPGDLFHSVSLLPEAMGERLSRVRGVEAAVPIVVRTVVFRVGGRDRDLRLVGVDPVRPIAGPPAIERGKELPGSGELIVDRVFARNAGLDLGDDVRIGGRRFRISGIASGGNTIILQFGWAQLDDVQAIFGMQGVANFFAVRGSDPTLAQRIADQVPGVQPMSETDFVQRNLADLEEGFLPIVFVLVVVAFVVGAAVIGLTIYTATLEKRREYGVMKAVGISRRRLFGIVYVQAGIAAAIGLVAGVVTTLAVAAAVEAVVPAFVVRLTGVDLALVAGAVAAMAIVASFVPTRPVARLQPAEVFRI